ncbi:hypothetical protein LTR85_008779 [Meristemomyces frigidus]|nr:hypothetical protein LTR85_008779 [Meristemomyces frigidus]
MDCSPLKKLPPELRKSIYEYILCEHEEIHLSVKESISLLKSLRPENKDGGALDCNLGITVACKEVRHESVGLFFAKNSFIVHADVMDWATSFTGCADLKAKTRMAVLILRGWLHSLGDNVRLLQSVEITLGQWDASESVEAGPQFVLEAIKHFNAAFRGIPIKPTIAVEVIWSMFWTWEGNKGSSPIKLPLPSLRLCRSAVEKAHNDAISRIALETDVGMAKYYTEELSGFHKELSALLSELESSGVARAGD